MPASYTIYKPEVREYILKNFKQDASILDVGAGIGTYARLLSPEMTNIEAVEIFKPYIDKYKLHDIYKVVHESDIMDFKFDYYNLIIIGDVLEHLTIENAQKLIAYIYDKCDDFIIAVPYMYKQGVEEDNIYEIHLQPDLTPANMLERYPSLKLLIGNHLYGYYMKNGV